MNNFTLRNKKRKEAAERERLDFIEELFNHELVALKEELVNTWEFHVLRLLSKISPRPFKTEINTFTDKLKKIKFLHQLDNESQATAFQKLDRPFVRYYSVGLAIWRD